MVGYLHTTLTTLRNGYNQTDMEKETIKRKYDELVSSIEDAKIYDGRGEYNGYVCENCGYITATFYKDKGVTPFVIRCGICGKPAMHKITSRNTPPHTDNISDVKNWVRPTFDQLVKMSDATIDHVLNGGLIFEDELKRKE
nr:MAG TPA: DNA-directed RNA polymerase [Caudoviricetes sp.]